MPNYVHEWTQKSTGKDHKLEVLTYDTEYGGADTAVDVGLFVSVGEVERAFDELPVGMMVAPTLDVTVNFDKATTAQKTYLRNAQSGDRKNLWIFSTDYGSGYVVEFVGVQALNESGKYTRAQKDAPWIAEYKLVDAFWEIAKQTNGATLCAQVGAGSSSFPTLFDVDFATPAERTDYRYNIDAFRGGRCKPNTWAGIMEGVGQHFGARWIDRMLHESTVLTVLDIASDEPIPYSNTTNAGLSAIWTRAVTLYGTNQTVPRAVGSALTAATGMLPTHIYDGSELIGGYASANDKTGMGQYQSAADWLKDLAENMAVKISWTYSKKTAPLGADYIGLDMLVSRVFDQGTTNVINLDDQLDSELEIEEGASVVSKVEVRWDGEDDDLTDIIAHSTSSRKQRSFTAQVKVHNNPMTKEFVRNKGFEGSGKDAITVGLPKSNILCFDIGGNLVKAHERVDIHDGAADTTYLSANSADPATGDDLDDTRVNLWCLSVQEESGLPYALANFYLSAFGGRTQATVEFETELTAFSDWDLRHRVSFTGAGTTTLSHLPWTNGVVTKIVKDFETGKQKITVFMAENV